MHKLLFGLIATILLTSGCTEKAAPLIPGTVIAKKTSTEELIVATDDGETVAVAYPGPRFSGFNVGQRIRIQRQEDSYALVDRWAWQKK